MRGTDGASKSAQAMEVVGLDTRTMATRSVSDEFTADGVYLNTATMGLPPRRAVDALHAVLDRWQRGLSDATEFDAAVTRSRAGYAALVGVDQAVVAVGPQVSVFAGQIAASLPAGAEVITAANEFTSVTFPFWARGLAVTEIPLADIADALTERTALVAVSAVQSADGNVLDVDSLLAAAARTGTRVLLDTTQAIGWFPIDASRVDYTVCGGYKFLLAPRGTAFLTVRPQLIAEMSAVNANWYAGERPWDSIYGGPLRLATNARRFDISPACALLGRTSRQPRPTHRPRRRRLARARIRAGQRVPNPGRTTYQRQRHRQRRRRGQRRRHTQHGPHPGQYPQRPTPPRLPRQQHR
jgi:selenocysteine lyase/cysteine desulfurase